MTLSQQTLFQIRYVGEKLSSALLVLLAAVTLSFAAVHLAPGDAVSMFLGDNETPETRALVERDWGLDRPLWEQYATYLGKVVQGDLGRSYIQGLPVSDILFGPRIVASGQLTGLATLFAVVISLTFALATAGRQGVARKIVSYVELVFASMPGFWLGIMLIFFFSFQLGLFPVTTGSELQRLVLPALTLALPLAAVLGQVIREGIEKALEQPHAVTALSRGINGWELRSRHALRHSLLPATTLTGWAVGGMLTGTVIVEQVFGRTGIGQATVDAVMTHDIPVVLGVAIIAATIYVVVNTAVDIAYLWVDPRLRTRG